MYIEEMIKELQARVEALENATKPQEEWLTIMEAASRLKVGQSTIRKKIADGEIFATKKAGSYRVPISQFYDQETRDVIYELPKVKETTGQVEPQWIIDLRKEVFGKEVLV